VPRLVAAFKSADKSAPPKPLASLRSGFRIPVPSNPFNGVADVGRGGAVPRYGYAVPRYDIAIHGHGQAVSFTGQRLLGATAW